MPLKLWRKVLPDWLLLTNAEKNGIFKWGGWTFMGEVLDRFTSDDRFTLGLHDA